MEIMHAFLKNNDSEYVMRDFGKLRMYSKYLTF